MVITRFAPSPTGYLHVGGLRTALYAYLFAKKHGGKIILRIEDTDQKREVKGATENLIKTLSWAGITFDEGPHVGGPQSPYLQSERTDLYQFHARNLIEKGKAYYCFCTEERLEQLRLQQEASKAPTGYDGRCRLLTEAEVQELLKSNTPHVIRLKVPKEEWIVFEDLIRGKVKFLSHTVDDQVLLKSDGFPTYHLANVVDDHLMEVTHVIRGEEWLPSTPKHVLLYQAFEWKAPQFAHLSLILNSDRSKLSKRQGDVAVEDYIAKGFEKEELLNFIAFLGWNPGGTKEIYSLSQLIEAFDLYKVQKAGAIFNIEKLRWYRGVWKQRKLADLIRAENFLATLQETKQGGWKIDVPKDTDRYTLGKVVLSWAEPFLFEKEEKNEHFLLRCLYILREKIAQDPEKVNEFLNPYFSPAPLKKELLTNPAMKIDAEVVKKALQISEETLRTLDVWDEPSLRGALSSAITEHQLTNAELLWPLRVALTHEEFSPGAFESAWILGKDLTLARIRESLMDIQ